MVIDAQICKHIAYVSCGGFKVVAEKPCITTQKIEEKSRDGNPITRNTKQIKA
jgi:hypothetical protein